MARDSDLVSVVRAWADAAPGGRVDPITLGIAFAEGWGSDFSLPLPGGRLPSRQTFNQLFWLCTKLIVEINTRGAGLEWDDMLDYTHPATVLGSDNEPYVSLMDSGPNNGGAVDPVGENPRVRWQHLLVAMSGRTAAQITAEINEATAAELSISEDATYRWPYSGREVRVRMWGGGASGGGATRQGAGTSHNGNAGENTTVTINGVTYTVTGGVGGNSGASSPPGQGGGGGNPGGNQGGDGLPGPNQPGGSGAAPPQPGAGRGGAGGDTDNTSAGAHSGGGGGSGGYRDFTVPLGLGDEITVVVGMGGAAVAGLLPGEAGQAGWVLLSPA